MPGMNSGLSPADPTLVAAFRSALLHRPDPVPRVTFLGVWATVRVWRPATEGTPRRGEPGERREPRERREARGRMVLRVGFGLIWILDGILQAQPKMAGGLASQVIEPAASASPSWVQHLVNWGGTIWSYHPITAGAASVWIQVGIGVWLLVAAHGTWSRLAGLAAVAWGLVVWVFGESFGGIFAPGLSWLTGAPGAVAIYVVAGGLVALPRTPGAARGWGGCCWAGPGCSSSAWPCCRRGRAAGSGRASATASRAPWPAWSSRWPRPRSRTVLSALMARFGSFAASNGFAVNLVAVIALAATGAAFVTGRPRLVRYAVWSGLVFCLADWVLVQDFGFRGGLGTDPNSMVPWILLFSPGTSRSPRRRPKRSPSLPGPGRGPASGRPGRWRRWASS